MIEYSVIMTAFHGGRFLQKALASMRQTDFPSDGLELLVVGAEGDQEARRLTEAESAVSKFPVSFISCASANTARMLNEACSAARGEVLVFTEDDCVAPPEWLGNIKETFRRQPGAGIVGGPDDLEGGGGAFGSALDWVLNSFLGTGGLRGPEEPRLGRYYPKVWNMALPKGVALEVSLGEKEGRPLLFNEALPVHADVELADRIEASGGRIVFAPEARVGHHRETTFLGFAGRNFEMARACRSLGVHRLAQSALAAFVLALVALAAASLLSPPWRPVLGAFLGIYGALLVASALAGFGRTGRASALVLVPPLLASLHLARGLGYLFPLRKEARPGS